MAAKSKWTRPRREKVRKIEARLRELHGPKRNQPHGDPVAELVRTILSQHTSDLNRDRAYDSLRAALPSWEQVRDAAPQEVEDAVRPGGLAGSKAPRIQAALAAAGDPIDLDWLADAPRDQAMGFLTSLPGVGRKTAACVMLFTFNRPEIPVDVHVERVGKRLGLFRPKASSEEAHDLIQTMVEPDDGFEFHMNLIGHGRTICRPKPRCGECPLTRMCVYYREGGPER